MEINIEKIPRETDKKNVSICLEERIIKLVDNYCKNNRLNRSSLINGVLKQMFANKNGN